MVNTRDVKSDTNAAKLCGTVMEGLNFSHKTYGETFYTFILGVTRNSGYMDRVVVMISERILGELAIDSGHKFIIDGQIRTYNENIDGHNKLNIVVFCREIEEASPEERDQNEVFLDGYVCKKTVQRISPLGRRICDIMLAVNRMYNKSDYIPCIAWGRNAIFSGTLEVGDKLSLFGRLQSREYKKKQDDGDVEIKTAYEVSILQLEKLTDNMI